MIHLIMGGARSGKSSYAERCVLKLKNLRDQANASTTGISYIATATVFDSEMEQRIQKHQLQRAGQPWQLIECPNELANCIAQLFDNNIYLVECLTLWLSNMLLQASDLYQDDVAAIDQFLHQQVGTLVNSLVASEVDLVMVSNEIGQGVVPLGELNRLFVDHMGWLNQAIAKIADRVDFVCAGIAKPLKSSELKLTRQQVN